MKQEKTMNRRQLTGQRLLALFILGVPALNFPILALFSREGMIAGIPVLYVYIFLCWAMLIGLMAVVVGPRT